MYRKIEKGACWKLRRACALSKKMEENIRKEIIRYCRSLHDRNMLAAGDGNLSVRLDAERIIITPSGKNKAFIDPSDLAVLKLDGQVVKGSPSSEFHMHLEIYRARPDARAVVHAHPPIAIAWSVSFPELRELPFEALPEVILATGTVPIVPYVCPGTRAVGEALLPYLTANPPRKVMILGRHGAVAWGATLQEAYDGIERVEHSAQILKAARELGGLTPLSLAELDELRRLRASKGNVNL